MGTRGLLTMIWPSPASVGARMAERIPASSNEIPGKTARAATAPRTSVSSMPMLNRRAGSALACLKTLMSVLLASVNRSSTRPSSATVSSTPIPSSATWSSVPTAYTRMPAVVNRRGAVTTLFSSRAETRL